MYYKHYVKNLQMETFIYDLYLFIITKDNHALKIIKMQINNTLIFEDAKFLTRK